jgi:hypothetical protein
MLDSNNSSRPLDKVSPNRSASADMRAQSAAERGRVAAASAAAAALFVKQGTSMCEPIDDLADGGSVAGVAAGVPRGMLTPLTAEALRRHVETPPSSPLVRTPSLASRRRDSAPPSPLRAASGRFDATALPFHCADEYVH